MNASTAHSSDSIDSSSESEQQPRQPASQKERPTNDRPGNHDSRKTGGAVTTARSRRRMQPPPGLFNDEERRNKVKVKKDISPRRTAEQPQEDAEMLEDMPFRGSSVYQDGGTHASDSKSSTVGVVPACVPESQLQTQGFSDALVVDVDTDVVRPLKTRTSSRLAGPNQSLPANQRSSSSLLIDWSAPGRSSHEQHDTNPVLKTSITYEKSRHSRRRGAGMGAASSSFIGADHHLPHNEDAFVRESEVHVLQPTATDDGSYVALNAEDPSVAKHECGTAPAAIAPNPQDRHTSSAESAIAEEEQRSGHQLYSELAAATAAAVCAANPLAVVDQIRHLQQQEQAAALIAALDLHQRQQQQLPHQHSHPSSQHARIPMQTAADAISSVVGLNSLLLPGAATISGSNIAGASNSVSASGMDVIGRLRAQALSAAFPSTRAPAPPATNPLLSGAVGGNNFGLVCGLPKIASSPPGPAAAATPTPGAFPLSNKILLDAAFALLNPATKTNSDAPSASSCSRPAHPLTSPAAKSSSHALLRESNQDDTCEQHTSGTTEEEVRRSGLRNAPELIMDSTCAQIDQSVKASKVTEGVKEVIMIDLSDDEVQDDNDGRAGESRNDGHDSVASEKMWSDDDFVGQHRSIDRIDYGCVMVQTEKGSGKDCREPLSTVAPIEAKTAKRGARLHRQTHRSSKRVHKKLGETDVESQPLVRNASTVALESVSVQGKCEHPRGRLVGASDPVETADGEFDSGEPVGRGCKRAPSDVTDEDWPRGPHRKRAATALLNSSGTPRSDGLKESTTLASKGAIAGRQRTQCRFTEKVPQVSRDQNAQFDDDRGGGSVTWPSDGSVAAKGCPVAGTNFPEETGNEKVPPIAPSPGDGATMNKKLSCDLAELAGPFVRGMMEEKEEVFSFIEGDFHSVVQAAAENLIQVLPWSVQQIPAKSTALSAGTTQRHDKALCFGAANMTQDEEDVMCSSTGPESNKRFILTRADFDALAAEVVAGRRRVARAAVQIALVEIGERHEEIISRMSRDLPADQSRVKQQRLDPIDSLLSCVRGGSEEGAAVKASPEEAIEENFSDRRDLTVPAKTSGEPTTNAGSTIPTNASAASSCVATPMEPPCQTSHVGNRINSGQHEAVVAAAAAQAEQLLRSQGKTHQEELLKKDKKVKALQDQLRSLKQQQRMEEVHHSHKIDAMENANKAYVAKLVKHHHDIVGRTKLWAEEDRMKHERELRSLMSASTHALRRFRDSKDGNSVESPPLVIL